MSIYIMPTDKPLLFGALTDAEKRFRMLGTPIVRTNVYEPSPYELLEMKKRGVIDVAQIVEVNNGNGDVVKVAVNGDGEIVDAKAEQNLVPLAVAAAIAFAIFGG